MKFLFDGDEARSGSIRRCVMVAMTAVTCCMLSLVIGVEVALAQAAPMTTEPTATTGGLIMRYIALLPLVFLFFYLLVVQPEKQKVKRQQELLNSITKGDQLVTSSGLVGKFSGVEGNLVLLEVGNGTKLKFEASAIVRRYEAPAQGDANGKSKAA